MTITEIKRILAEAQDHAGAVARSGPDSEDIRVLSIAIAEIARATGELAKKVRNLED